MEKISQADKPKEKASVAILISDKTDFKPKWVKIEKEHYIPNIEKTHQEDIVILNIVAQNKRKPTFIKETLLQSKSHIDPHN